MEQQAATIENRNKKRKKAGSRSGKVNNREALIRAGIKEMNSKGLDGFSVRHAAEICGVSCAAPAKHFGDRNGYIAEIMRTIIREWHDIQGEIMERNAGDVRKALVESSIEYIKFLIDNPHFIFVLKVRDEKFESVFRDMRFEMSYATGRMIIKYCRQVGMPADVRERKLYVVRSLIYGAALMFDNQEMKYTEEALENVRYSIDREFDLP